MGTCGGMDRVSCTLASTALLSDIRRSPNWTQHSSSSVLGPQSPAVRCSLGPLNLTKTHWQFLWCVPPAHPSLSPPLCPWPRPSSLTESSFQVILWSILPRSHPSSWLLFVDQKALLTKQRSDPDRQGSPWSVQILNSLFPAAIANTVCCAHCLRDYTCRV